MAMRAEHVFGGKRWLTLALVLSLTTSSLGGVLDTRLGVDFLVKYVEFTDVLNLNFFAAPGGALLAPNAVKQLSAKRRVAVSTFEVADHVALTSAVTRGAQAGVLNAAYLDTPSDLELLREASNQGPLLRRYRWLILCRSVAAINTTSSIYLPVDNKVMFVEQTSPNSTVLKLYDIYQATMFTSQQVRAVGQFTATGGLSMAMKDPAQSRTNFTGLHLRCVTLPQEPFTYLAPGPDGTTVLQSGHIADVWRILQNTLGFTYTCRQPADMTFGVLSNGEWGGMMRALVDGEADVIVAPLDYTVERAAAVDFTIGLRNTATRMVTKKRALMDSTWTTFTQEFTKEAWGGTLALVFLAPPFLAFITQLSPSEKVKISLRDAYVISVGALAFQGASVETTSGAGRIVFIVIFLGTLLTYCYYTSALTASLTIASTTLPVESLQDVVNSGHYDIGIKLGTSRQGEFQHSLTSPFREAWQRFIQPNLGLMPTSHQEGIDKVAEGGYVFLLDENVFVYEFGSDCRVTLIPPRYFETPTGLAFSQGSPYVKIFNQLILRMRNGGILDRSWEQLQPAKNLCDNSDVISLNPTQLFTAFLLLMVGAGLAILMLPVEKWYWNRYGKKKVEEEIQPPSLYWGTWG
ncbi:probable glutamate receptor [Hyalella azteca]|uniref:Probable glutamate receptor n=1 Tax=Hyalella azteca TaxID=294128 RepID=A0A8B7N8H5_HYAAZ|nr:probable glutamate receptor [Hyalella azteca]